MTDTVFVTGGTGLTGANVCRQLIERGDHVKALARGSADTDPLVALGVELVEGDITDSESVMAASKGCDAAIHTAALLGGASQNIDDFWAVNTQGTINVLDAGAAHGMRRVVALSTGTFFDQTGGLSLEDAPVLPEVGGDPYTTTKRAAFLECVARAEAGQDVVTGHPGAIYGTSPVASRALHWTSFNGVIVGALRQKISKYLSFPVTWVLGNDVAWGSIAALDHGVAGERYLLDGRPQDVISIAACCNIACEVAGIDHRLEDITEFDDPALEAEFGPPLVALAKTAAAHKSSPRSTETKTHARLGYDPTSLEDGLAQLVPWLKDLGKIGPRKEA